MELRIKEVLKEKGLTAVWLASEIGIAQPSMSNIVNDKTKPSLETLDRIAFALNVSITELFERADNNTLRCPNCGTRLEVNEIK